MNDSVVRAQDFHLCNQTGVPSGLGFFLGQGSHLLYLISTPLPEFAGFDLDYALQNKQTLKFIMN